MKSQINTATSGTGKILSYQNQMSKIFGSKLIDVKYCFEFSNKLGVSVLKSLKLIKSNEAIKSEIDKYFDIEENEQRFISLTKEIISEIETQYYPQEEIFSNEPHIKPFPAYEEISNEDEIDEKYSKIIKCEIGIFNNSDTEISSYFRKKFSDFLQECYNDYFCNRC